MTAKPEAPANSGRKNRAIQWRVLILALAIIGIVIVYHSVTTYRAITIQEQQQLLTQSRVISTNMHRSLESADLVLQGLVTDLPGFNAASNTPGVIGRLKALTSAMPGIRTLLTLDAKGVVVASSREELIGTDFSHRSYYQVPIEQGDMTTLYVSPPFKSVFGPIILNLSRIIPAPDGTFGGVVVAALDPNYFGVLLSSVRYAPDLVCAVTHGDGLRFMVVPERPDLVGENQDEPGSFFARHKAGSRAENIFTGQSASTGEQNMVAIQTVRPDGLKMNTPLYVFVSRSLDAIYGPWRRQLPATALFFVLLCSASTAGLIVALRRQRQLEEQARQTQALVNLRLGLLEYAATHDMQELLQQTLDEVCGLSHSPIGFYHFVESDQQTLSLQAWSTRTLKEYCTAKGHGRHYPVGEAGVWADCIRQRRPIMHNNYATLPDKKRLPAGHAPLIRELVVPIFRGQRVVAILGIGNKPDDYTAQDVELVSYLADVAWEITERKRGEEERHKLGLRYQTLQSVARDGIHILDEEGNLVESNSSFRRMLGYNATDELQLNVAAWDAGILPEELTARVRELIHAPAVFDSRHRRRDGTIFDVEISACGVQLDGKWYLYASSRDITGRKELEANLARSNRELEQFAYIASHDLQEPLRKIAGFTELLAKRYQGTFDEKGESYMAYIVDGATRMRTLINDILAYSRVIHKARELAETDCSQVVAGVLQDMELTIRENKAEILCGPLPAIQADQTQLGQLFQNLIGNAIRYHGAASPRITINATRQQNEWLFSVADNGIGVAPEFYQRIFAIFQRLHTRAEYPGTGVGLAICQKIVDRHGGKIWVESTVGSGATFFFTLPSTPNNKETLI
jgi:PAS domain S-box-containing protein